MIPIHIGETNLYPLAKWVAREHLFVPLNNHHNLEEAETLLNLRNQRTKQIS
jgi:hypothetical protein